MIIHYSSKTMIGNMMVQTLKKILLPLLLMLTAACWADTESRAVAAPAVASADTVAALEAETVLWKVSKAGQPDSYLIGTLHVGKKDRMLPAAFQAALRQSAQLAVETEAADEDYLLAHPDEAQRIVAIMLHNRPLKDTVGHARLAAVRERFAGSPVEGMLPSLQADSLLAPWVVSFYLDYVMLPPNYALEQGVDRLLMQAAKQQGKPIVGLEDGTAALSILREQLPDEVAVRGIDDFFAHEAQLRRETQAMLNDYEQGRISQMWHQTHGAAAVRYVNPQDRAQMQRLADELLLAQRNRNWMPKLLALLPERSHTVAVGAAHLFGEYGLIALLRQNGYTVTPLPM